MLKNTVLYVVDNKYRELYGIRSLKNLLKTYSINLIIVNKNNYKYALKCFNPEILILPKIISYGINIVNECKKMPAAYKIATIVVSASIEPEAFGRVSVEAQSMEKPIIASNIGGSNETIIDNKTGILFESGKPESLSKKIIEVLQLDETTLKSLGNEGRKNVINKFNVEKMCFSTYSEYKKLINA